MENAIYEARWGSSELQLLWEQWERGDWPRDEFWEVFWGKALPVLGIRMPTPSTHKERSAPRRERGSSRRERRKGEVLIEECNKAGRVFFNHRGATDYEIWKRYREGRTKGDPDLLSKNMVGYLCTALAEEWLPWSHRGKGRLLVSRIPGDFRASPETLVIPREEPAS
jgi:hypothetical protein